MIKHGFHIGKRDWYVMVYYDVYPEQLDEIGDALLASGASREMVDEALYVLRDKDTGYTFTNYHDHFSVIVISHTTSAEQALDTIIHEIKHLVEHISSYYSVNPKDELAAYLQGEVGRNMFPALAMLVCPNCNGYRRIKMH